MAKKLKPKNAAPKNGGEAATVKALGTTASQPSSNLTDDAIRDHFNILKGAKAKVEKAVGEMRAARKSAKADGCDLKTLDRLLAAFDVGAEEIDRQTREFNRYARVMGLPIGTQLGMFDGGESVASAIERDTGQAGLISPSDIAQAKKAGYDDGFDARAMSHGHEPGSPLALAYEAEWHNAQKELAAKSFKGGGKVRERNGPASVPTETPAT